MNDLLQNLDRLHTTARGALRIKRNLQLETADAVPWCRALLLAGDAVFERRGKNWYVTSGACRLTVDAHSYTVITAHKIG